MARSPDRVWRALDGEALLKTYRLAAGHLYQAQLRWELTRKLGLEWRQPENGMAELAGVPERALQAFSQRREQVLDYLEQQGTSGFYAARVAALATREHKEPLDLPRLQEEWLARAAEHGLGRRDLENLLGRTRSLELGEREFREIAARLLGPNGLTGKQTTFSAAEAVVAWAQTQRAGAPAEQVLAIAGRFTALPGVERVTAAFAPGRPAAFSTSELIRTEQAALALAERGQGVGAPAVSLASVEDVTRERATLTPEQQAMLHEVATSPDRVVCVVGRAGAGKTTALAAVSDTFLRDGVTVLGCAPSGIAAEQLAREAGIASGTLHRLLAAAEAHGGLPESCVLIVDEAGMADTRTLTRVLEEVERVSGKAILVGDPAQLPAVGPGGLFPALADRLGAVELRDNHRQRDRLERQALAALRAGDSGPYLGHAAEQGRLLLADDPVEAKARLLADWWTLARDDLAGNAMIAYRRRDVADLNSVARGLMEREGRLGPDRLLLPGGVEVSAGDRVVCLRNDRRLGVVNGSRGSVATIDEQAGTLVLETDSGGRVRLSAAYLEAGHLEYAYALTGHKTQGLTLERAFVLAAGEGNLKEWGYVALSRARRETRLYTTASELAPDTPPAYRPERPAPLDRFARALTRPAAEPLALDARARQDPPARDRRAELLQEGRALFERRQQLEEQRAEAVGKLRAQERELAGLGFLARARRGKGLGEQVERQRGNVAAIDTALTGVDRESEALNKRRERERLQTLRTQRELGISRTPARQSELELELEL